MNKKRIVSMVTAACMLLGLTQSVAAYQTDGEEAVNSVQIGYNTTHVEEIFPDPQPLVPGQDNHIEKTAVVVNDNSVASYIRVSLAYSDSDIGNAVTLNQLDTTNWVYISIDDDMNLGGYYYYQNSILPGERTTPLFDAVTVTSGADYRYQTENEDFEILVYEESIAKGTNETYEEAWNRYINQ